MDRNEERILGGKTAIWYTDGSETTKSTGAGCQAKGEGNNIVINLSSMATVFQAEITAVT